MTLTVKEKEHWKNRVARKIDQAVEAVLAAENPNYMEGIKRQAKDRALVSLGIAELTKEVQNIDAQKEQLDKQRFRVMKGMLAVVRGVDPDDIDDYSSRYGHCEVQTAIDRRQNLLENELLAKDSLGKRILHLTREKEELLDTVWLAASPKQIKELWTTVSTVLDQEPTELQKEALNIKPMDSGID